MFVHTRLKGKKIHQNPKAKRLSAAERKKLPAKAFGIPKDRKYPMMVLNKMGKPEWSHSHASDAKARAKQELDRGLMTETTYKRIVKKADKVIQEAVDAAIPAPGKKKNPKTKGGRSQKKNPKKNPHYPAGSDRANEIDPYGNYFEGVITDPDEIKETTALTADGREYHVLAVRVGDRWANVHRIRAGDFGENPPGYGIRYWMEDYMLEAAGIPSVNPRKISRTKMRKNPLFKITKGAGIKKIREVVSKNIATEMDAGKPQEQAVAIAISSAREDARRVGGKTAKLIHAEYPQQNPTRAGKRPRTQIRLSNPSAEVHEKTGRDYMMKARDYYERYLEKGRPNDLVDAFEYLSIAHEELMYAGDHEALKEVKHGKKIAKAELLERLRSKRKAKKRTKKK